MEEPYKSLKRKQMLFIFFLVLVDLGWIMVYYSDEAAWLRKILDLEFRD